MEWKEVWAKVRRFAKENFKYSLKDGEGAGVQLLNRVCERSGVSITELPDYEGKAGSADFPLSAQHIAAVRPRFCGSYVEWSTWTGADTDFDAFVPDCPEAEKMIKNRGSNIEEFYNAVVGATEAYSKDVGPTNRAVRECHDMLGSLLLQLEQPQSAKELFGKSRNLTGLSRACEALGEYKEAVAYAETQVSECEERKTEGRVQLANGVESERSEERTA